MVAVFPTAITHAKGGRPRNLIKLLNKINLRLEQALPDVFTALINKALEIIPITCPQCGFKHDIIGCGDKEVAMYLIDRRLGKPRQQVDSNIMQATVNLSPADYAKWADRLNEFQESQKRKVKELPVGNEDDKLEDKTANNDIEYQI